MYTLDQFIERLQTLREQMGNETMVLLSNHNASRTFEPASVESQYVVQVCENLYEAAPNDPKECLERDDVIEVVSIF